MKADLILKNAKIYTVNDEQPWAEAAVHICNGYKRAGEPADTGNRI